ncbi:MAG: hypothetical protein PW734_07545 [Verrucomicrobium sp.]|nr:hypothetical protein [Verrucomicrobium sp.]
MKFRLFCLACLAALTVGCASSGDSASASSNDVDASGQPVSTIPWNRPQSWETGGALGSMMGQ